MRSTLLSLLPYTLAAFATPLPASDLKFDGRTTVVKLMGDRLQIDVSGGANLPVTLLLDVSAGPTVVFGVSVPLGFTPALAVLPLGQTDAGGNLSLALPLPSFPGLAGAQVFAVAVIADPSAPFGLDVSNGADLTLRDRDIDLAGRSMRLFPHFQHVAAVNAGSSLQLGIDPTRYPFIVGNTADVYVVASKTRSQWLADDTLTDVRGAPQAVTFAAGTIQANTVTLDAGTLAGPDVTPGNGDLRIGVPYDIVIDFNRDGRFNGTDLADGYSDREAGFYIVRDTTVGSVGPATRVGPGTGAGGPYAVTEIQYDLGATWVPVAGSPTTFLRQDVYYPTNIAQLGQLPLIAISHGNGHNYQWYDHLGYHLASYGYVVMSHSNNTIPGTLTASLTTLDNTDAFLGSLATIGGGVLAGHVDGDTIVWIGHSRGGDSIVRAYDQLIDGTMTMTNYDASDIVLLSSIAPVQDGGPSSSNPHAVPYHLWVGVADSNVPGCACRDREQWYIMHDRAQKSRQSISLYGVGHGWFHAQTNQNPWVTGPCQLDEPKTHEIMLGYVLPLVEYHVRGDVPSKDFLWRQWDRFRPIGVPFGECNIVNLQFQESPDSGKHIIDDFQSGAGVALASSGATVTSDLPELFEGRYDDGDFGFDALPTDPMNGFIMASAFDTSAGAVLGFDGTGDYHLTYSLPAGQRNLHAFDHLSFRAAQTTRHPLTTARLEDLRFFVTLVDGTGAQSSMNIGAYGGGIEEPYQRTTNPPPAGCASCIGAVPGWNNEFETIRLRLTDFLNNGNAIDLADVRQIVFQFGPSWGSPEGRIGLDEIELTVR